MASNFNADLFVTCAAVIPVLFLALVVQDGAYNLLLKAAMRGLDEVHDGNAGSPLPVSAWSPVLGSVAYVIWLAGVDGEVMALLSLYWRSGGFGLLVLIMTLVLVGAVGFSALRGYLRLRLATFKLIKNERNRVKLDLDRLSQGDGPPEDQPAHG